LILPVNGDETTAVKKQRDHSASSSSSKTSNLSSSSGEIKPPQVIQTEAKKANNKRKHCSQIQTNWVIYF
jgi:hypothetical protein